MSGADIIQQLESLLKADKLDTRAGLYFLGELVKDAFEYIEEQKAGTKAAGTTLGSFEGRIKAVETKLDRFLEKREEEQNEAKEERKFYRRAVIGGLITIIISQIAQWLLR